MENVLNWSPAMSIDIIKISNVHIIVEILSATTSTDVTPGNLCPLEIQLYTKKIWTHAHTIRPGPPPCTFYWAINPTTK